MHVNPEEAVQIHQDVRSRLSLAMHWGTFPLTAEAPTDPPQKLRLALETVSIPNHRFQAVPIGHTSEIPPL